MNIFRGLIDYITLNRHLYNYSKENIEKYQLKQLQKLFSFVMEKSEFYRKIYKNKEIKSFDDFFTFPTINKIIMMENFDQLNTCGLKLKELTSFALEKELNKNYDGYYQNKYVVGLSSGTGGNKGIYITPKELTKRAPFVFLARSGIPLKLLPFNILFLLRVFSQGFKDINSPFIKLKYLSTMTKIEHIIDTINENKINILMAPPSLLRILLPFANRIKVKLGIIVTYAEVLFDEDKEKLNKAFGCNVIQIYQASEGQIGSSCKCGNLHINEDLVFVELYDRNGKIVDKPGVIAEKMILTNLVNYAQPLIRYEMNDIIVLGEKCKCGSNFRTIRNILGRNDDVIFLKNINGENQHIFPDLISRWIITTSDDIREFKLIQKGENIELIIDTLENSDKENIRKSLLKRFNDELSQFDIFNPKININFQKIELPENISKYKRFEKIF